MIRPLFIAAPVLIVLSMAFGAGRVDAISPSMTRSGESESGSAASSIRWYDDFNAGWREAHRRNVPMMIFVSSQRCRYCDAMEVQTWCDPSIAAEVQDRFVAIHLDRRRNAEVLSRITVPMFPMTLVGLPQGKIVGHLQGFQRPENIRDLMSRVLPRN